MYNYLKIYWYLSLLILNLLMILICIIEIYLNGKNKDKITHYFPILFAGFAVYCIINLFVLFKDEN